MAEEATDAINLEIGELRLLRYQMARQCDLLREPLERL